MRHGWPTVPSSFCNACLRHGNRRAPVAWRSVPHCCVVLLLVALCAGPGCSTFRKKGVTDNMVAARQMSLRGTDALQRGNMQEAEGLFSSAIEKCAADERARAGYAETLWQRGAQDEAVRHLEEAVRLSGGDPQMLVRLGEMNLAKGDLDGASLRADLALRTARQSPAAWALKGDVERARGKLDDALSHYHRALSFQEHFPRVQIAVAEIYRQQNRPQRALATLDHLNERFAPGQTPDDVHVLRGLAQKALGRYDDASESFLAATRRGAATPDVWYHLAETQFLAGDPLAARTAVSEALRVDHTHAASLRLSARLESDQQRMASAAESRMR